METNPTLERKEVSSVKKLVIKVTERPLASEQSSGSPAAISGGGNCGSKSGSGGKCAYNPGAITKCQSPGGCKCA